MVEKTVFILWGWYDNSEKYDQKVLGLWETEEEATAYRDKASPNINVFCLYEGYLGRPWQASMPGEIPRVIYFVQKEGNTFVPTDMIKVARFLKRWRYS